MTNGIHTQREGSLEAVERFLYLEGLLDLVRRRLRLKSRALLLVPPLRGHLLGRGVRLLLRSQLARGLRLRRGGRFVFPALRAGGNSGASSVLVVLRRREGERQHEQQARAREAARASSS